MPGPLASFFEEEEQEDPPIVGGVVITGSAGGVGFAYAGEFMDRGYDVVICDVKDCSSAAAALTARHPNGTVFHTKCDVSDSNSVVKLGEFAKEKLGTVAYWINNAGEKEKKCNFRVVNVVFVTGIFKTVCNSLDLIG